jgi:hypothetical protein
MVKTMVVVRSTLGNGGVRRNVVEELLDIRLAGAVLDAFPNQGKLGGWVSNLHIPIQQLVLGVLLGLLLRVLFPLLFSRNKTL